MSSVTASIVRHRRIITLRLILRDLVEEDWPDVLAYQCDPRYLYYPWEGRTEADLRELVGMFLEQHTEAPRRKFQLAITLPDQPGLIENCGIRRKPDNDREVDIRYEVSPSTGGVASQQRPHRRSSISGFKNWTCTGYLRGALRITPLQHMFWRNSASFRKAGCARTSILRAVGGIHCCMECIPPIGPVPDLKTENDIAKNSDCWRG